MTGRDTGENKLMRYAESRNKRICRQTVYGGERKRSNDHSQVSSLDYEMGMEIGHIGNRIVGEDSKFDLGYIHSEVPEGQRSGFLGGRWEM